MSIRHRETCERHRHQIPMVTRKPKRRHAKALQQAHAIDSDQVVHKRLDFMVPEVESK
ncbi:hypothetical protein X739_08920 [Mesorhizobium sp. LNHC220B00]|nr:hypothetical protein X739_08920 [Mesorhizobium sp. LNHC220B00]